MRVATRFAVKTRQPGDRLSPGLTSTGLTHGPSTRYILRHGDRDYDSKAIAAVAFGIQHKTTPLRAKGGETHGGIKPHEAGGVSMTLDVVIVGMDGLSVKMAGSKGC
jgi:hypothetical protein